MTLFFKVDRVGIGAVQAKNGYEIIDEVWLYRVEN
jgi:hypothetical protein